MNIKNAFRYQNFLTSLERNAQYKLNSVKTKQTETHQKSLANSNVADEVKEAENLDIAAGITAEGCIALMFDIFEEKSKLDAIIAEAKKQADFDFDAEMNTNKARRELINALSPYLGYSDSERMSRANDFIFNAEGNQVPFSYPVKIETELTYDKKALSEKVKKLSADADDISDKADAFLLSTELEFEPKFDIHDKFEDIVKTYSTDA